MNKMIDFYEDGRLDNEVGLCDHCQKEQGINVYDPCVEELEGVQVEVCLCRRCYDEFVDSI